MKNLYQLNITLIIISVLIVVSSVLLECIGGNDFMNITFKTWVWLHIIICTIFMLLVFNHLALHWGKVSNWFKKVHTLHSKPTKWLSWLSLITFITGIIAAIMFISEEDHNPFGGIHGKFGLIVIILFIFHLKKRIKWFKGRKSGKAFHPLINEEICIKCGKCVKKCPAQVFEKEEKQIIIAKPEFCLQCMKCVKLCPKKAIN